MSLLSTPSCLRLNLAPATTCQPTVDPSNTVNNSVEMWQACPADQWTTKRGERQGGKKEKWKQSRRNKRVSETHVNEDQHHQRGTLPIPISPFLFFLLFVCPWPYSSFITPPKWIVIFPYRCQPPFQSLSQEQVPLSYYNIRPVMGGAFLQSLTFTQALMTPTVSRLLQIYRKKTQKTT